jgi:hypothetical protein
VRPETDSDPAPEPDFDDDYDPPARRGSPLRGAARIVGGAVVLVAALTILYVAFHGPVFHRAASTGPATARPDATSAPAASAPPATLTSPSSSAAAGRPSASPPAAFPSASASPATGPLGARAQAYLAGRRGQVEAVVYDLSGRQQWTLGSQAPQPEAGVVQLEILEAVLSHRTAQRTVLSLTEQKLTPPMIEQGDNQAATTLWGDVGGAKGMRAFDHRAGLGRTTPSSVALTTSTPLDQVTLLRLLVQPNRVLDENDQKYALRLLENVTPSQRWGVSSGVPAGVTVALENGWRQLGAGHSGWQVNSVGLVSGDGRDYLVALFSAGNPSRQYGIDTLGHLGAMVWGSLAPRS